MPPLGYSGLADGVLITEEPHFIERIFRGHGGEPVHFDKILGLLRVVGVLLVKIGVPQNVEAGAFPFGCLDFEIVYGLHPFFHDADTDIPSLGNLDPHPVSGREELQRLAIPTAAARVDESILHGILPRTGSGVAKGNIELAVPRRLFAFQFGRGSHVRLCLAGVDEPGAAEKLLRAVLEDLEEEHVDRDVAGVQIRDDALGRVVEFRRNEDDLVRLVECFLVQLCAEVLLKRLAKISAVGKAPVNLHDLVGRELLHP